MTYIWTNFLSLKSSNSLVTPLHSLWNQFYTPTQFWQWITAGLHLNFEFPLQLYFLEKNLLVWEINTTLQLSAINPLQLNILLYLSREGTTNCSSWCNQFPSFSYGHKQPPVIYNTIQPKKYHWTMPFSSTPSEMLLLSIITSSRAFCSE